MGLLITVTESLAKITAFVTTQNRLARLTKLEQKKHSLVCVQAVVNEYTTQLTNTQS